MQQVTVIGAGFSGLVTAYYLSKQGFSVRVVEKTLRAGGLIQTFRTPDGLVETAANGLLSSLKLEQLCADINVPLLTTRPDARRRFIYRGRPRRMPLGVGELISVAFRLASSAMSLKPKEFETVGEWGRRVLGVTATDYVLTPVLGGIYAGDPERLSACLIFSRAALPDHLRTTRPEKGKLRGTVAPAFGMQQLIDGLSAYLERNGVEISFNEEWNCDLTQPTVVCVSAQSAAKCLKQIAPELSDALAKVEMLSLVTATTFYAAAAERLKGFGCLFPADQGFRARGVLFNNSIFSNRGPAHSETWIFGGARDLSVADLSEDEIAALVRSERLKFYGSEQAPLGVRITRWPRTLPHYSIDLERTLTTLPAPPENIALVGNYLGRIGLAKILERAALVGKEFGKKFG